MQMKKGCITKGSLCMWVDYCIPYSTMMSPDRRKILMKLSTHAHNHVELEKH